MTSGRVLGPEINGIVSRAPKSGVQKNQANGKLFSLKEAWTSTLRSAHAEGIRCQPDTGQGVRVVCALFTAYRGPKRCCNAVRSTSRLRWLPTLRHRTTALNAIYARLFRTLHA
jgi:hypothetical protein